MARCAYMHNRICGALDANKNVWKKMKGLGLIPKINDAHHGFSLKELTSISRMSQFQQIKIPLFPLISFIILLLMAFHLKSI